jgi:acetyl/propionyl-CoA carboxylase alpha subunit
VVRDCGMAAVSSRPALHVRVHNRDRTVTFGAKGTLSIDGVTVTAIPAGPRCWRVVTPEGTRLVYVSGNDDRLWAFVDGDVLHGQVDRGGRSRRRRREVDGTLSSPMPATVREVLVTAGEHVAKGKTLIVLEAMKMELPLRAPQEGVVRAVQCRPGDLVQPGIPLVEIE